MAVLSGIEIKIFTHDIFERKFVLTIGFLHFFFLILVFIPVILETYSSQAGFKLEDRNVPCDIVSRS